MNSAVNAIEAPADDTQVIEGNETTTTESTSEPLIARLNQAPDAGQVDSLTSTLTGEPTTPAEPEPVPENYFWSDSPDWRGDIVKATGGDDKLLKRLERFTDPISYFKTEQHAQTLISQGKQGETPDESSTEEEWTDYRARMGVPEASNDYDIISNGDGQYGDADLLNNELISQVAHQHNLSNEVATQFANTIKAREELAVEDRRLLDQSDQVSAERQTQEMWGPDKASNMYAMNLLLDKAPEGLKAKFLHMRDPETGTTNINNPEVLNWLAGVAREAFPASVVVPNSQNPSGDIASEMKDIQTMMRDKPDDYFADQTVQDRYKELLAVDMRLKEAAQ
jgi:hypothetical protein